MTSLAPAGTELELLYSYHDWEHFSSIRNLKGPHSGFPRVRETPAPSVPPPPEKEKPKAKSTGKLPKVRLKLSASSASASKGTSTKEAPPLPAVVPPAQPTPPVVAVVWSQPSGIKSDIFVTGKEIIQKHRIRSSCRQRRSARLPLRRQAPRRPRQRVHPRQLLILSLRDAAERSRPPLLPLVQSATLLLRLQAPLHLARWPEVSEIPSCYQKHDTDAKQLRSVLLHLPPKSRQRSAVVVVQPRMLLPPMPLQLAPRSVVAHPRPLLRIAKMRSPLRKKSRQGSADAHLRPRQLTVTRTKK